MGLSRILIRRKLAFTQTPVRVHCLPKYLIISVVDAIPDFIGLTDKKKRVPAALAPGTCI